MEQNIIIWLQKHSSNFLDMFFIAHSHLVSWIGVLFFLVVIFLFVSKKFALIYGGGFGVTILLNYIIKIIIARPRPYIANARIINKLSTIGHSFPSGHSVSTIFMVLMFFALFKYLKTQKRYSLFNKLWFKIITLIIATVMLTTTAFARMYLGQHYISDILAGFLVGEMGFALTTYIFLKILKNKV